METLAISPAKYMISFSMAFYGFFPQIPANSTALFGTMLSPGVIEIERK
jgi:hypothetical protein